MPRLDSSVPRRTTNLTVRVRAWELATIASAARAERMSISEFVRHVVMTAAVRSLSQQTDAVASD